MAPYLLRQRIHRSQQDHLERVTNQEDQPQINADKTLKNLIMFKKLVLSVSICLQRRLRSLRHFLQVVLRLSDPTAIPRTPTHAALRLDSASLGA